MVEIGHGAAGPDRRAHDRRRVWLHINCKVRAVAISGATCRGLFLQDGLTPEIYVLRLEDAANGPRREQPPVTEMVEKGTLPVAKSIRLRPCT